MSLLSSVEDKGEVVTQVIGFSSGNKKTWSGVKTDTIQQSEFTRFDTIDGRRVYINTRNVDWFEIIPETA
jgi:hypothetical protein